MYLADPARAHAACAFHGRGGPAGPTHLNELQITEPGFKTGASDLFLLQFPAPRLPQGAGFAGADRPAQEPANPGLTSGLPRVMEGHRGALGVICCHPMADRYPIILGVIEEVAEGFTVTVFLRAAPGLDGAILLAEQSADTIDEACGVIRRIAKERSISEADTEFEVRLFDVGPPRGLTN
jgi:hypothetical protein